MRPTILAFTALLAFSPSALAYDACGNPPEAPVLAANPGTASEGEAKQAVEDDKAYALDIEGYLVCLQLAESDVNAEAKRGERSRISTDALQQGFQNAGGDARGRQSGWRDAFDRWSKAWSRAHGKPMPEADPD